MATLLKKEIQIDDLKALDAFTQVLASKLQGSEVIELRSDLGGGKTAFVRSLLTHLSSRDSVNSPSFTIENIYSCPHFDIHHFDFYRLKQAGVCAYELSEALADDQQIVIIEWGQIVSHLLPEERLVIEIICQPTKEQLNRRLFCFMASTSFSYLISDL